MIAIVAFVNIFAAVTCAIAAGMNFSSGNIGTGIAMSGLCAVNILLLITNLMR